MKKLWFWLIMMFEPAIVPEITTPEILIEGGLPEYLHNTTQGRLMALGVEMARLKRAVWVEIVPWSLLNAETGKAAE